MGKFYGVITGLVFWLLIAPGQVQAGSFEDAVAARNRGDFAAAFGQFQSLANAGDPAAQFELNLLYLNGKGSDPILGKRCTGLNKLLYEGTNPPNPTWVWRSIGGRYLAQNEVKAYIWSNIAAASGDRVAATNRDVAARKFSPTELEQVKALAMECQRRFADIAKLPQCL